MRGKSVLALLVLIVIAALAIFTFFLGPPAKVQPEGSSGKNGLGPADGNGATPLQESPQLTDAELVARGKVLNASAPKMDSPDWMRWYESLNPTDRRAWARAKDESAVPSMVGDKEVSFEAKRSRVFSIHFVRGHQNLMQAPKDLGIRPLQVSSTRTKDGIKSVLWARMARKSIEIDWSKESIENVNIDTAKAGTNPIPQHLPAGANILGNGQKLGVKINSDTGFSIPWDANSTVYPLALDGEYRYAFGLEKNKSKSPPVVDGIVVLDLQKKELVDIVSIPDAPMGVHVIFEPADQYLLVFESTWKWIMLIDLAGKP